MVATGCVTEVQLPYVLSIFFLCRHPSPYRTTSPCPERCIDRLLGLHLFEWPFANLTPRPPLPPVVVFMEFAPLPQAETMTQQGIGALMTDMSEREKKTLFAGSVPIGLNRNQVVIGELNFNDNLYLLCTGIVRVQRVKVMPLVTHA